MKLVTIVGARPQFIKAATVSKALRGHHKVREVLVHTGQHYDENMSGLFFADLDIPDPKYNLGIGSESHPKQTARMLESLESVILHEKPDWVIVYGDTNSTLAGALAASQLRIPVAHVEAGLRSFNRSMPEERNRVVADHLSDILFAPTKAAVRNLEHEGIENTKIYLVGDVMFDAALYYGKKISVRKSSVVPQDLITGEYSLASVHRAENTDNFAKLENIFNALIKVTETAPVVLPLHPRTRECLKNLNMLDKVERHIKILPPVGYLDMIVLIKHASVVFTDSGGLQKEAFFFNVPCLTLREETEWVELVNLGVNKLVGTNPDKIFNAYKQKDIMKGSTVKPYGQGNAALKIAKTITRGM